MIKWFVFLMEFLWNIPAGSADGFNPCFTAADEIVVLTHHRVTSCNWKSGVCRRLVTNWVPAMNCLCGFGPST